MMRLTFVSPTLVGSHMKEDNNKTNTNSITFEEDNETIADEDKQVDMQLAAEPAIHTGSIAKPLILSEQQCALWPPRKRRDTRRLVLKIIQTLEGQDQTKHTQRDVSKLNWAKQILADLDKLQNKGKDDNSPSTANSLVPTDQTKKHKPSARKRRNRVKKVHRINLNEKKLKQGHGNADKLPLNKYLPSQNNLQVHAISEIQKWTTPNTLSEISGNVMAVIDRTAVGGRIAHLNWALLEAALTSVFLQVYQEMPGSPPKCQDAGWFQGQIKLVAFEDDRSIAMYKAALSKIGELWPGAALELVSKDKLPVRPRAWSWIPHTPANKGTILKILNDCNPHLPAHDWDIVKLDQSDGGRRKIFLTVNKESLPILAKTNGIISYAFGQITIQIYKKDNYIFNPMAKSMNQEAAMKNENNINYLHTLDCSEDEDEMAWEFDDDVADNSGSS